MRRAMAPVLGRFEVFPEAITQPILWNDQVGKRHVFFGSNATTRDSSGGQRVAVLLEGDQKERKIF
jgi:hypothetical protein